MADQRRGLSKVPLHVPRQAIPTMTMRVLVADDHPLVVDALALYLKEIDPDVEVLGAGSVASALERLEENSVDLILLNFGMPGMNGLEGLRQVHEAYPDVPLVMITGSARPQDMLGALDRGAAGVLLKEYSRTAIIKALELILAGERHVPAKLLSGAGLREPAGSYGAPHAPAAEDPLGALNAREREVLALLAEGLSNADIGAALKMTADGANHHLKNIYRKLGVRKRTQAMAMYYARRRAGAEGH
jgi:two-component system nitrate/nitrite response regulator NarL